MKFSFTFAFFLKFIMIYFRNAFLWLKNKFCYYISKEMNKNCADYRNLDGKTLKKIVQSPGGSSSMTLAWNN